MSKPAPGKEAEDLWSKIESSAYVVSESAAEESGDTTTVFVGDAGCGKSTLIQGFLKPTANKDPKPTFALDYNFARKKAASGQNTSKSVAHIWELGGEINEPKLLEIPITSRNLASTVVAICCDMSKPHNILASLKRWITLVRDTIKKRLAELSAVDGAAATALREAAQNQYTTHENDASRVKPCEIPLYIILNKYDLFKTRSLSDRRSYLQLVRFIAHFHGASVVTTSAVDSSLRESFRNFMAVSCFRSPSRQTCETAADRPVQVSAGKDDFLAILVSSLGGTKETSDGSRSRLLYSEADAAGFLTSTGVSRDCWKRFDEHLIGVFGPADAVPEPTEATKEEENEFPEPDVDEMRVQRDVALQRYIQESERKEALIAKMSAPTSNSSNNNNSKPSAPTKREAK